MRFAIDGAYFEIDPSPENATRLRDALAEYVRHARRVESLDTGPERPRRQFSFAGSISAEPDFAERSEEILEEIARRNSA